MMPKLSNTTLGGIATLLILLSSGITLFIQDDPNRSYGTCSEGWKLQEDGTYACVSRNIKGEYCFSTTATRCYFGFKVKTEEPQYIQPTSSSWEPKVIDGQEFWIKKGVTSCYKDGLADQRIDNCQVGS